MPHKPTCESKKIRILGEKRLLSNKSTPYTVKLVLNAPCLINDPLKIAPKY